MDNDERMCKKCRLVVEGNSSYCGRCGAALEKDSHKDRCDRGFRTACTLAAGSLALALLTFKAGSVIMSVFLGPGALLAYILKPSLATGWGMGHGGFIFLFFTTPAAYFVFGLGIGYLTGKKSEIALATVGFIIASILLAQAPSAIARKINPKRAESTFGDSAVIKHSWSFCPNARGAYTIPLTYLENPKKQPLTQILGFSTSSIRIESKSADLNDAAAAARVLSMLNSKPRRLASFPMWAEATQFNHDWVVGALDTEQKTMIEIAGLSACVKDSKGQYWFFRNAKYDTWK